MSAYLDNTWFAARCAELSAQVDAINFVGTYARDLGGLNPLPLLRAMHLIRESESEMKRLTAENAALKQRVEQLQHPAKAEEEK